MNPFLQKLGYSPDDRVVIFHADDIGMCHATIPAIEQLFAAGLLSSAAAMVPCSWFPALAAYAREHPQADIGVHLTFTCEWDVYRWGPVGLRDPFSGMLDDEGYFYRTTAAAQQHSNPEAVATELRAQVDRAITAGIDITHIDSHMGTLFHPTFFRAYLELAIQYRVPVMVPRLNSTLMQQRRMDADMVAFFQTAQEWMDARGLPLCDTITALPLEQPGDRLAIAQQQIAALPPGLTHFILHPAADTPELRAICNDWPARVADLHVFVEPTLREYAHAQGLHVIGYRTLRDAMRA